MLARFTQTENFVQCTFDAVEELKGGTLVLGGDGRFYNDVAIQTVIKMAAANGIKKVFVAANGLFCTPAVSASIRARKATGMSVVCFGLSSAGAIILTASHNPGGPTEDFGIKYNVSNGGPAPESVTERIFQKTESISSYKTSDVPDVCSFINLRS
jgi:phosphoglucomutase